MVGLFEPAITATNPPIEVNSQFVKRFILKRKLRILACSSLRGQFSISDREEEGRFTKAFLVLLKNTLPIISEMVFQLGNELWKIRKQKPMP